MRRFTKTFTNNTPGDGSERKAIILAALFSVVAAVMFIGFYYRARAERRPCINNFSVPPLTSTRSEVVIQEPLKEDPNPRFRVIPVEFSRVDFKNRSYGQYKFVTGKKIDLKLNHGDYEYNERPDGELGWFHLSDILFADVTGDGNPEAIIWISHVDCGGSCDGGSGLFYVYSIEGDELQELWRYETGSYGYGCGFKSLTLMNRQLMLQMFGRCADPGRFEVTGNRKFLVDDTTNVTFRFNGSRFVKRDTDFMSASTRDVNNYQAEINIIQ